MSESATTHDKSAASKSAQRNSYHQILEDLGVTKESNLFMRAKKAVIRASKKLMQGVKAKAPGPAVQRNTTPSADSPTPTRPGLR